METAEMCSSDVYKTVLSGTLVAVLGLIFNEIMVFAFFERTRKFSSLQGRIAEALVFWADIYSSGPAAKDKYWEAAGDDLRKCAAELSAFIHQRHRFLFWLPAKMEIKDAAASLIGLSNSRSSHDPKMVSQNRSKIEANLRLECQR